MIRLLFDFSTENQICRFLSCTQLKMGVSNEVNNKKSCLFCIPFNFIFCIYNVLVIVFGKISPLFQHQIVNGAKVRSFLNHSCTILSSFTIVITFNNTSADFVFISADVLLKMITILKELRIAQLCSKNERTLHSSIFQKL